MHYLNSRAGVSSSCCYLPVSVPAGTSLPQLTAVSSLPVLPWQPVPKREIVWDREELAHHPSKSPAPTYRKLPLQRPHSQCMIEAIPILRPGKGLSGNREPIRPLLNLHATSLHGRTSTTKESSSSHRMMESRCRISTAPGDLREWSRSTHRPATENVINSRTTPKCQTMFSSLSRNSLNTSSTLLSDELSSSILPIASSRPPDMSASEFLEAFVSIRHGLTYPSSENDSSSLPLSVRGSRLLWSQESTRDNQFGGGRRGTRRVGSEARRPLSTSQKRFRTLAKYTKYHVFCGDHCSPGVRERERGREREKKKKKEW